MPDATTVRLDEGQWFGHPRGLSTLFFTELWERFSYYGMRALLILYMTAEYINGGFGFDAAKSGAIYALYTSTVYMSSLPGGWIADNLLGHRRSVVVGGILMAIGNFMLATPSLAFFYIGLATIGFGTGLLKPNVSTMVGQLYREGDPRRDSGFSIYYIGINIGAFLAPLVCGFIARQFNWHVAFATAGVGMVLGLIQFVWGGRRLGTAGLHPAPAQGEGEMARRLRNFLIGLGAVATIVAVLIILGSTGRIAITVEGISNAWGVVLGVITVGTFAWIFFAGKWTKVERNRIIVIVILFLCSATFWGAFEQAGSSLNLFARDSTNRMISGWEFPAAWFQSLNALFIVIFAGVFAWLWLWLNKRRKEPSSPGKFAMGLILAGLGLLVMVAASHFSSMGGKVSPLWLVGVYLIHTFGELSVSPVGLSAVTKLAPSRVAGLMMGVWFLALALGNYGGGRMAGLYETLPLTQLFLIVALIPIATAMLLIVFIKPIKGLMGEIN